MIRFCIFCILSIAVPNAAMAYAFGDAEYEVTHVASKKELHVTATFDVEGATELFFPVSSVSSNAVQMHIKDIVFSISTSRIEHKNNMYRFSSPKKERIKISYIIKNPIDLKNAIELAPYVSSNNFYFNERFLILPNVKISSFREILLKPKIKFNIPSNHLLFSSNSNIEKGKFVELILLLDKQTQIMGMKPTLFVSGSREILKTNRITTKNGSMDLLFLGIPSKNISLIKDKTQKIYDIECSLFDLPKKYHHIPFALFIDNDQVRATDAGEQGVNFNGSLMYIVSGDGACKTVLAHEFIHNWINLNDASSGITESIFYQWFIEGFTEYYAWKTTLNGGLITKDQAMVRVNLFNYIARVNPLWAKSYLEIASAQYQFQISYHKGFLLAAELDQKIFAATKGKHSLDDIMRLLVKKFQSGTKFSTELLKSQIQQLAGSSFDDIFVAIEYGDKFTPTSTPFGIKTKLKYIQTYFPKYGFDIGSTAITQKITKLDKNSPAYKAGLRDGNFFPRDRNQMQSEPNPGSHTVTLIIGTKAGEKTITYTADSEKIMVPQYEIVE